MNTNPLRRDNPTSYTLCIGKQEDGSAVESECTLQGGKMFGCGIYFYSSSLFPLRYCKCVATITNMDL